MVQYDVTYNVDSDGKPVTPNISGVSFDLDITMTDLLGDQVLWLAPNGS